jgi:type I restriction enzyme S subunit
MCITIAANIADSAILGFDACFPDSVVGFIPAACIGDARYFEYFLRTAKNRLMDFATSTAQKNINLEILNALLVPLPPIAELHRIVSKVNELMVMCDNLEAKLTQSSEVAEKLAGAVVNHMSL